MLTNNLGAVTDSYAYDAYGNLIAASGASNNAYLFAGEQRDSETGLDYLRARYYDPLVGRFVSADAYEGTLNDPMSLHDYQYAHANPVVNTDPSGYMTNFGELLSTIATHGVLSSMAYVTGYATGTQITGGDGLAIYDKFLAGFADGASGGLSTQFRAQQYGEVATRNHRGAFFNLGRVMGNVANLGLGWGAPTSLANVGWAGRVAQLHEMFSTGLGAYQSTQAILESRATVANKNDWLFMGRRDSA